MALIILSQKLYVFPNTIKHPYGRSGESVLIISAYTKDKGGTSEEIPPVAYSIFRIQRRIKENICQSELAPLFGFAPGKFRTLQGLNPCGIHTPGIQLGGTRTTSRPV